MSSVPASIDAYVKDFPEPMQTILHSIRQAIHGAIPEADETISYGMPAFKYIKESQSSILAAGKAT